jgi:hypothetical protein
MTSKIVITILLICTLTICSANDGPVVQLMQGLAIGVCDNWMAKCAETKTVEKCIALQQFFCGTSGASTVAP